MSYTIEEAAREMRCSPAIVQRLVNDKFLHVGADGRIPASHVAAVLKNDSLMALVGKIRKELAVEAQTAAEQEEQRKQRLANITRELKVARNAGEFRRQDELINELFQLTGATSGE